MSGSVFNDGTLDAPSAGATFGDGVVTQSVSYRCLLAAQAVIQSLGLANVDAANVVVRKLPLDRGLGAGLPIQFPAVLLTPERETMDPTAGVAGLDDVVYGVRVTVVDVDNQESTLLANLDKYSLWREQIARAFRNQRLSGVPEVINAHVDPADPILPDAWQDNLYAAGLLLRFVSREPRSVE